MKTSRLLIIPGLLIALAAGQSWAEDALPPKAELRLSKGLQRAFEIAENVLAHPEELNLTAAQKDKLVALKDKLAKAFEKIKDDPEVLGLVGKFQAARKSKDPEALRDLRRQLHEKIESKTGLSEQALLNEATSILTPEQLLKIATLRKDLKDENGKAKLRQERKAAQATDAERKEADKNAPLLNGN